MQQDPVQSTPERVTPDPIPSRAGSLGTLLLGMIIGGAVVAGLVNFSSPRKTEPAVDLEAIRAAARDGAQQGARDALSQPAPGSAAKASGASESVAPAPDASSGEQIFNVVHRPANTIGNESAPVTIVEYSDFECGYCRSFYNTTLQQVINDYVKTGKVKISYKHFPFLADSSLLKAMLSECAAEQGKFWEMHNALFGGRIPKADEASMNQQATQLAAEFGMDGARFGGCLANPQVRQRVIDDASEAQKVGVRGTPTFLINGKLLVGAQSYAAFRMAIEQAQTRQ